MRLPSLASVAVLVLLLPWAIWAVFRGLGADRSSTTAQLVVFTPYVALTAPVPLVVALLLRRWIVSALAAIVVLVLAALVLPRAFGSEQPEVEGRRLTVMTLNTNDGRADARAIMRLVRKEQVDILSLQETQRILVGLEAAGAGKILPGRVVARARAGGSVLMARQGVFIRSQFERRRGVPPTAALRPAGGLGVTIEGVHLPHPTSPANYLAWETALAEVPTGGSGRRVRILAGDFNGTLDHRAIRGLLNRGYAEAADLEGGGLDMTWPTTRRFPPLVAIDHVIVDRRIRVGGFRTFDVPGTDHRAVVVRLTVPR